MTLFQRQLLASNDMVLMINFHKWISCTNVTIERRSNGFDGLKQIFLKNNPCVCWIG